MILLPELIARGAHRHAEREALRHRGQGVGYGELAAHVEHTARGLVGLGVRPSDRVAVYLEKRIETVTAMLAALAAGATVVPVNPLLKRQQVRHILADCEPAALVTSAPRLELLDPPSVKRIITVDEQHGPGTLQDSGVIPWSELDKLASVEASLPTLESEQRAAILYTSGSTGLPKGVVLSHGNLACAAESVAEYLRHTGEDRLLALLPLSFDAGLTQLTSGFYAGACVILMDYLLPREVIQTIERERVSGLTAVPPIWIPLAERPWPAGVARHLRYVASTGGVMPTGTVRALRAALPRTKVYLMYGFTEAFRATYLDPAEIERRPDSVGKPIPHAEVHVVRADGSPCDPDEVGELVQAGPLVAEGYWNNREATAERFRTLKRPDGSNVPAVWSGDLVRRDAAGFLYFVARDDEMIKASGYRVSPTEIESAVRDTGLAIDVLAVGIPHSSLGQVIALAAVPRSAETSAEQIIDACKRILPSYMVPAHVALEDALQQGPNGKLDRAAVGAALRSRFVAQASACP